VAASSSLLAAGSRRATALSAGMVGFSVMPTSASSGSTVPPSAGGFGEIPAVFDEINHVNADYL